MRRRRQFDKGFKIEAVRLAEESGKSLGQIADDLGVDRSSLGRWVKEFRSDSQDTFPGSGHQKPEEEGLRHLQRENAILREERDILKKALGIFSRVPK